MFKGDLDHPQRLHVDFQNGFVLLALGRLLLAHGKRTEGLAQAEALGALERCAVAASLSVATNDLQRCLRTAFIATRCVSAVAKFGSDKPLPLLRSIPAVLRAVIDLTAAASSVGAAAWSEAETSASPARTRNLANMEITFFSCGRLARLGRLRR